LQVQHFCWLVCFLRLAHDCTHTCRHATHPAASHSSLAPMVRGTSLCITQVACVTRPRRVCRVG
jgi:hypothetical protein